MKLLLCIIPSLSSLKTCHSSFIFILNKNRSSTILPIPDLRKFITNLYSLNFFVSLLMKYLLKSFPYQCPGYFDYTFNNSLLNTLLLQYLIQPAVKLNLSCFIHLLPINSKTRSTWNCARCQLNNDYVAYIILMIFVL